jgi:hypothetical protein
MKFEELYRLVIEDVQGMDTYWSTEDGKQKVTIKDVLEYIDKKNIPTKKVSIQKIKPILIDQDYKGAAKDRVERAELKYPIIVVKKNGKYKSILDGNHRVFKALKKKIDIIKVRELDLDAKETPKIFKELFGYEITPLEEQNIRDISTNDITKAPKDFRQMAGNVYSGAYIEWQMRQDGYSEDDIKKYWSMRHEGTTHEYALKQIPPPKAKEINYQNPEVQRKIKQAFIKMGYNTQEDMDVITDLLKPERINSLKASMLANRMDINKILQESFVSGTYGDEDKKYSIDKLVKLVSNRKPKNIPIDKVIIKNKTLETAEGNFLENIKKPNKKFYDRVMRANTKYPIMLSEEGWIIDGSHRVSKLKWEGEKYIKVHIISKDDLEKTQIFDDEELKKSERV